MPISRFLQKALTLGLGALLLACSTQATEPPPEATPVGLTRVHYEDPTRQRWDGPGPRPLDVAVWYPAPAGTCQTAWRVAIFNAGVNAIDAPLATAPAQLPLVLLSHGTGGSAASIGWLAEALAARGYLVAAVNHHGNTGAEGPLRLEGFVVWGDRPRDLSVVLDRLLVDPRFGPRIDPQRIGVAGFSIGGYTALASVGARLDFAQWQRFCAAQPGDSNCKLPPESPHSADDLARLLADNPRVKAEIARVGDTHTDPRLRAAFVLAPALGPVYTEASLRAIARPVQITVGALDDQTRPGLNAQPIAQAITGAQLQVLPGVGHYSFLSRCNLLGRWQAPGVCTEAPGTEREEVHRKVAADALRFFDQHLALTAAGSLAASSAVPTCATPAHLDDGWALTPPAAAGFDPQALCDAMQSVAPSPTNFHSVLVERRGQLVAELYRPGPDRPITRLWGLVNLVPGDSDFGPSTRHDVRSVSKSLVGLLVGAMQQQGQGLDVTRPALDFFPELADLRTPQTQAITLDHLLTMGSGHVWEEGALPNDEHQLFWKAEPARFLFSRPLVTPPGNAFNYNGGGTWALAEVVARTGGAPFPELMQRLLFTPMGISDVEWATDLRGRPMPFNGARMRPRDMAKVGRLVLNGGRWQGQQLVPQAWVTESLKPRLATGRKLPSGEPIFYGYHWRSGTLNWHGKTLTWASALGNGGQMIYVLPELDLSLVTTAGGYGSPEVFDHTAQLLQQVANSLKE